MGSIPSRRSYITVAQTRECDREWVRSNDGSSRGATLPQPSLGPEQTPPRSFHLTTVVSPKTVWRGVSLDPITCDVVNENDRTLDNVNATTMNLYSTPVRHHCRRPQTTCKMALSVSAVCTARQGIRDMRGPGSTCWKHEDNQLGPET